MSDPRDTGWETWGKHNYTKGPRVKPHRGQKPTEDANPDRIDRKAMERIGYPEDKMPRKRTR